MSVKRSGFVLGAILLPAVIVLVLSLLGSAVAARLEAGPSKGSVAAGQPITLELRPAVESSALQDAFVFRFDPVLESFETFTVPTSGAEPHSVAVISNGGYLDVWFTEPGADMIGRLIYTGTQDYAFHEYAVSPDGRPLNLAVDESGGSVWFTEQAGNRIGRLEVGNGTAVTYTAFNVATPASQPSGIDVAPDGSVWFTEMAADKIGHLVVSGTSDLDLQEYPLESGAAPLPIKALSNDLVWFAETAQGNPARKAYVRQLSRANGSIALWIELGDSSSHPYDLEIVGDALWLTERGSGRLNQVIWATASVTQTYDIPHPQASPTGLRVVGGNTFWFTLETPGVIARMRYINANDVRFQFYPLPVPGLWAEDVAVDDNGKLWIVAFRSQKMFLPLVSADDGMPKPLYGVQTYAPVTYTHGLSEITEMGVHWVRLSSQWKDVEPFDVSPEQYDWTAWDARVSGAVAEDVEIMITLGGNPAWAAEYPMGPVTDMADLLEFLRAAVERYDGDGRDDAPGSPVITYWEIYNEPDNASRWYASLGGYGYFGHNGAGYAALLEAVYPVVKAASPRAQVVFGGVAHDSFERDGGPFDEDFVEDVLANCTGRCFDVMNFHYFPNARARWEPYGADVIGKRNYLASRLAYYGYDRPMMCTETTWAAAVWGNPYLQARYVPMVYTRGMAAGLLAMNWYALNDVDPTLPGLLDSGYQPKLAFYTFKTLTAQIGRARFIRPLSAQETGGGEVEGYVFEVRVGGGTERRDVVWYDCPSFVPYPPRDCPGSSQAMVIAAAAVRAIDVYGNERVVRDSDDGKADGKVTLVVTDSPIYIDYSP